MKESLSNANARTHGEASDARVVRIVPGHPPELVVFDRTSSCPYASDRAARLPLRLPARNLRADELDHRLADGDRRQGPVLYRTHCPDCAACVPLRIDVERFLPSRSHRRILGRGQRELTIEFASPSADARRVNLYNRHKLERGLGDVASQIDQEGFRTFLVDTCCDSLEMSIWHRGTLAAAAILDRGFSSMSAVYCYYDPDLARYSLGTLAILKEIELCRIWGMRYLYLGLYVEGSAPMAYKARFFPHQQRRNGRWIAVEGPEDPLCRSATRCSDREC